ncbi:ABC transporter ATP-binding protein (plasmid) [Tistrella bauzanensis]|uniref:ABC transporter ATP-binding protein n=1 Tax=Tistrella TaxID=171436 RepID=UPI0031F6F93F
MAVLDLRGITRRFGATMALDGVDLTVPSGGFCSLIGPSGCGKTTLLRIAAGFVAADRGQVLLDGRDIAGLPPHRRGLGFVFQSYALFPTKTVAQNIGFALMLRGDSRRAIDRRVADLAAMVRLTGLEDRFPHELSGGQQQRVALARALAPEPPVLLLDEPLSALDAGIRVHLRAEIRRIVDSLGITTVYVTHDQEEALAISDTVVVMRHGRILQSGTPQAVYLRPAHSFVAGFVGTANLLPCTIDAAGAAVRVGRMTVAVDDMTAARGGAGLLVWRPEHTTLTPMDHAVPGEGLAGTVEASAFLGPVVRLTLRIDAGGTVTADIATRAWSIAGGTMAARGSRFRIGIDPAFARVLPADDASPPPPEALPHPVAAGGITGRMLADA